MTACEFQGAQKKGFRLQEGVGDRVKKRNEGSHMAIKVGGMRKTWASHCMDC